MAFANFGIHEPSQRDLQLIERYTCQLYSIESEIVNEARVKIFERAYTVMNGFGLAKKGNINTKTACA